MDIKIYVFASFLCSTQQIACLNQCTLLDQLVDMKKEFKEFKTAAPDLKQKMQFNADSVRQEMDGMRKNFAEFKKSLKAVTQKCELQGDEIYNLNTQFLNLTSYVQNRWDGANKMLAGIQSEFMRNMSFVVDNVNTLNQTVKELKDEIKNIREDIGQPMTRKKGCPTHLLDKGYVYNTDASLCWKLSNVTRNAHEAERICESDGGHLLVVSPANNNVVVAAMDQKKRNFVFVDGRLDKSSGQWLSWDNKPITWIPWGGTEPNGRGAEECILLSNYYKPRKAADYQCTRVFYFACQFDTN